MPLIDDSSSGADVDIPVARKPRPYTYPGSANQYVPEVDSVIAALNERWRIECIQHLLLGLRIMKQNGASRVDAQRRPRIAVLEKYLSDNRADLYVGANLILDAVTVHDGEVTPHHPYARGGVTKPDGMRAADPHPAAALSRSAPGRGQAGKGDRAHEQTEVAQGDVVEVAEQQVDDDSGQPRGDDVGTYPGQHGHQDTGRDFDDADGQHRPVGRSGTMSSIAGAR